VPLLGGDVAFVAPSGEEVARVAAGATLAWPPATTGGAAIVAGEAIIAAVARDGVLWARQLATPPRRGATVHGPPRDPVVLLARTGGWLERLDAPTVRCGGRRSWAPRRRAPAWLPAS